MVSMWDGTGSAQRSLLSVCGDVGDGVGDVGKDVGVARCYPIDDIRNVFEYNFFFNKMSGRTLMHIDLIVSIHEILCT